MKNSFGMMSIQEDDQRPEFLFGQEIEELHQLRNMVSQFKQMPNALLDKYLSALRIPKRENIRSSNPYDQSHTNPQIIGPPPPFDTEMSDLPDTSPSSVPRSLSFGINGMNNLISQMPDQPVLNISIPCPN